MAKRVAIVFTETADGEIHVGLEGHDPALNTAPLSQCPIAEYWARHSAMLCSRMIGIIKDAPSAPAAAGKAYAPWTGPPDPPPDA